MDRLDLMKLVHWIQEERLVSNIQFGFMTGKSSVDKRRRLMNDLEWKRGGSFPTFHLSIDLKGASERVDNVKLYRKVKESGMALLHLSLTLRPAVSSPEQDGDVIELEASPHRSTSRFALCFSPIQLIHQCDLGRIKLQEQRILPLC